MNAFYDRTMMKIHIPTWITCQPVLYKLHISIIHTCCIDNDRLEDQLIKLSELRCHKRRAFTFHLIFFRQFIYIRNVIPIFHKKVRFKDMALMSRYDKCTIVYLRHRYVPYLQHGRHRALIFISYSWFTASIIQLILFMYWRVFDFRF